MLPLHTLVIIIFIIIFQRFAWIAGNLAITLLCGTLLSTTDTLIIFATNTPPVSTGDTMAMTIAEVAFGNGHLAMKTIPEFHPGLTTGRVRAYEFIAMFNAIGNDKVGRLEVVIDGHSTSTAWYDDGTLRCCSDRVVKAWDDIV
jgi:hypothetical protein